MNFHTPVLLKEVIQGLNLKPGNIVFDGTVGGGGHALAIAKKIGRSGKIIATDLDPEALVVTKKLFAKAGIKTALILAHRNYTQLKEILDLNGIGSLDAILVDLGISSYDLDQSKRGFSFQKDEPLDMRFNPQASLENKAHHPLTARFILENYELNDLVRIFKEYGEEKYSRNIAKAILAARQARQIKSTAELFEIIKHALPAAIRFKAADSARRIFQALRIAVNDELKNIEIFLPQALAKLKSQGRLAVISFHSLEDRIVKHYFKDLLRGCICPPDFPRCVCGKKPLARAITGKPIMATEAEQLRNPRSKPAKLRIIQKI